ncbi:unnamed protein product [Orchesella dallaii]|uniref:ATP-binding cassette sub-family C member Sur n=1 Tax=Orchesella dallaii TaxID=48710 RepID=A0ABP1PMQ8_9HEXA
MLENLCDFELINHVLGSGNNDDNSTSSISDTEAPNISSACTFHGIELVHNSFFIYLSILILIYHKCQAQGNCSKGRRTLVPGRSQNRGSRSSRNGKRRHVNGGAAAENKWLSISKLFTKRTVFIHHLSVWNLTFVILLAVSGDVAENIILFLNRTTNVGNPVGASDANNSGNNHHSFISAPISHNLFENNDSNSSTIGLTTSSNHNKSSYPTNSDSVLDPISVLSELVTGDQSDDGGDGEVGVSSNSRSLDWRSQVQREKQERSQHEIIYEYLKIIGPLVTLTAVSVLLAFYHQFERIGDSKYLLINVLFFMVSSIFFLTKLYLHLSQAPTLTVAHVQIVVNGVAVLASAILTALLIHTVIHEKRDGKQLPTKQRATSKNIRYLHNYSTLPSRITFYWFTGLLRLGYWHPLEEEDLGELPEEEKTSTQLKRFQVVYEDERDTNPGSTFSLWRCLFKTIWQSLLVGGLFRLLADFSGFIAPLGIKAIVEYTEQNYTLFPTSNHHDSANTTLSNSSELTGGSLEHLTISQLISNGYVMALIVLVASFLQSTFSQCSTFLVNSEGIHMKLALQALIYKKSLTLSPTKSLQNQLGAGTEEENDDICSGEPDGDDDKRSGTSSTGRSSSTTHGFDNGSIVNIMSEDTNNIMMFFWMAHFIWAIPLKLGILMTLLYLQLGYSALIGAGVCILIMIPLQFLIGKKMSSNSKELMERCDERLRTISEILQGMKLLKLHGWELLFSQKVFQIREKELKNLDKDLLYRSIMTFLTHISSVLVTVVTFGLYPFIESEKLEPPKVFAGLALFNQLTVPLFIFPITVPVVIDALVSARRVREFLMLPEASSLPVENDKASSIESNGKEHGRDDGRKSPVKSQNLNVPLAKCRNSDLQASTDSVFVLENIAEDEEDQDSKECVKLLSSTISSLESSSSPNGVTDLTGPHKGNEKKGELSLQQNVVSVQNGSFTWDESITPLAASPLPGTPQQLSTRQNGLSEISIAIPKEKLTVVVGATGSGKTSLISAILGEMRKSCGEITWAKGISIAYAAQKPWMLNASVRDNILFGKPFKPGRYKKVIQACALQPDIDILPENDLTEIGQKGINLSGGQKQRIATARALYSNANVVILDDPLSALDVEVAHHVLDAGIIKLLLRSRRTVLLVTHHLPVLHHAYHIIAMERGRIRIQGTLPEIQAKDPQCYKEWQEMISRKEQELNIQREARTAKERWTLLKLVSKVGLQFKHNRMVDKGGWKTDEETNAGLEPFSRKKKGTFSHYKNLSHDIFLPSDECHDEMMTPLLRRRAVSRTSRDSRTSASSNKHVQLQRMSSLQPEATMKNKSPSVGKKFKRLQSLPAADDDVGSGTGNTGSKSSGAGGAVSSRNAASTGAVSMGAMNTSESLPSPPRVQDNLFKKLFSSKKTISSTGSSNTELEKISSSQRLPSTVSGASEGDLTEDEVEDPEEALLARESSQDEREYGKIPLRVYLSYITACGKLVSSLYLYSAIGYEVVRVYTNFWLSKWSDTANQYKDDQEKYEEIMSHYFNIYVILSLATVIVSLSCNLLGKQAGANSREILHQRMMDRVVRCPVRFFESTPIGRIINRFSSDVAVVDRKLCISMQRFLQFVFLCISAIVVNAIVNAWFLLLAIPIVAIYYYIQRFYRFSSRELQRIQAISRGPIYSHFHETLEGLSTIRAFREQKRFTNQMLVRLDSHNKADMFINVGNRWLSISLDYLGGVIVFLATLAAVISSHVYPEAVTASMVGLAINYTLLVPVYLNWVVKFLAEVEMFMNSVDRIDRYAELEIEDYDGVLPPDSLPPNWPTSGQVKFENVSVQYGPDRPVIISGLSVDVTEKQKVGICGRSGSGKSSLLMALFRISDVKNGRILIDGVNIHEIPLLKLRSSFSIIPQENILFSGTLRFNLDPEGKVPDIDIWSALELCQMKEAVMEMPGQLDADIKYGGESFSAGEKQLLALARAILHKSKVVIMDEATSSVDLGTERTLLQAVKDVFKDSTVLSIAHRLETIIDGDRVLVLEDGILVEDGNPSALIKKPMSHFATMVRTAGEQSRRNI